MIINTPELDYVRSLITFLLCWRISFVIISKRKNFCELHGVAALCHLSLNQMKTLFGVDDETFVSWASGAVMVPRVVERSMLIYLAATIHNPFAIDEVHHIFISGSAAKPDLSFVALLTRAGATEIRRRLDHLASIMAVSREVIRRWLAGELPPQAVAVALTAVVGLARGLHLGIIRALAKPSARSTRNPAVRDAEFCLAMTICDLDPAAVADLVGESEDTVTLWWLGEAPVPRAVWKILSLLATTPLDVANDLLARAKRGENILPGVDGSLAGAFLVSGFRAKNCEEVDVPLVAAFLDVPAVGIECWLAGADKAPGYLWVLLKLLFRLEPDVRGNFIAAFVDDDLVARNVKSPLLKAQNQFGAFRNPVTKQ